MGPVKTLIRFSDEQSMLLDSAVSFCREKSPVSRVRKLLNSEEGFDAGIWQEMVSLGWTGIAVPEHLGGSGLSLAEAVTIAEPLGRHLLATPFLSTQLFTQGLLAGGSPAQQQAFLPGVCQGAPATVALFEADGDWDLSHVAAQAVLEGDCVLLSGGKTLVCDAGVAQSFLVTVMLDGQPALALVKRDQIAAQALQRETIIDETRRAFSLNLEGVKVDKSLMISGDAAQKALQAIRNAALALYVAEAAGGIAGVLDVVVDYLNTRVTFGRKIGSYQSLKHTSAEILIGLERTRSHAYHAASLLAAGEDAEVALRMGKCEAGDSFVFAGDRAVQFHGGFGFTYECDAQLYLRRALWIQHAFGDALHHRRRLGEILLAA